MRDTTTPEATMHTAEKIDAVLQDFSTSFWLKHALTAALKRDPVDAANDAHFLANILKEHCQSVVYR